MTDIENAETLFQEYKVKEAYPLFEKLAGEGNGRAMYFMALFHQYYNGLRSLEPEESHGMGIEGSPPG